MATTTSPPTHSVGIHVMLPILFGRLVEMAFRHQDRVFVTEVECSMPAFGADPSATIKWQTSNGQDWDGEGEFTLTCLTARESTDGEGYLVITAGDGEKRGLISLDHLNTPLLIEWVNRKLRRE